MRSWFDRRRVLTPRGIVVGTGILDGPQSLLVLFLALIWMIIRAWFSRAKIVAFVANANRDDLALIGELLASGQLKSIIDRRHRLSEVPEAMRYQGTWRVRGKLVICMDAE